MRNLNGAFLYITLVGWCLVECVFLATMGVGFPLLLFTVGFLLVFSLLGCLNLSDRATDLVGGISTAIMALGLVIITIVTAVHGASWITNALKGFGALLAVVFSLYTLLPAIQEGKKSHA